MAILQNHREGGNKMSEGELNKRIQQGEVEVERYNLSTFSFTVEHAGKWYYLVVRRKINHPGRKPIQPFKPKKLENDYR